MFFVWIDIFMFEFYGYTHQFIDHFIFEINKNVISTFTDSPAQEANNEKKISNHKTSF